MANNKKKKTGKQATVSRQVLPWAAGVIVVLLVGLGLIAQLLLVEGPRQSRQSQAVNIVQQQAAVIDFTLSQYRARAQALANNTEVNTALAQGQRVSQLAQQLSAALTPAQVFLVKKGDQAAISQLSFLLRDSLGDASQQQPVVLLTAGKNSKLVMVYFSKNGAGSVLVEWPLSALWKQVGRSIPSGGGISVKQGSLTLVQTGNDNGSIQAQATTEKGLIVSVALPLHASMMQQPLFLIVALAMVVLSALLLWLLMRQLQRVIKADAELLAQQAKRLAKGAGSGNAQVRLASLAALGDLLSGLMKARVSSATGKKSKAPEKPDEFTDILVNDSDKAMLVEEDESATASLARALPEEIFRAYDIRGVVGDSLTPEYVELIGRAIGTEAEEAGQQTVLVARDGRLSGPELRDALVTGLRATGRDVVDLGDVPTPVLYYATKVMDTQTGVCITGSHNPADYNGLKIVLDGKPFSGERIQDLRKRIAQGDFAKGAGTLEERDITDRYLADIIQDVVLARQMKVVVDCGNGIAGKMAPGLLRELGCDVTELFCEVDGHFPNHHPNPSKEENLVDLIRTVEAEKADVGLAFDGDGDRVGVVTNKGEVIWADRLMMLFAKDVLSRSPGVDIIFDVKCSRALPSLIRRLGGRPLMWKTGHSFIKNKLQETGAPLAGEMSGHIFFADRWFGVDDGLYAAARLLEILSLDNRDSAGVFVGLRTGLTTPELNIETTDAAKFGLVDKLCAAANEFGGSATTLDGIRVDYPDGWGLLRASNTTPVLVARFEGKDTAALERIKTTFREQLSAVDNSLDIPF